MQIPERYVVPRQEYVSRKVTGSDPSAHKRFFYHETSVSISTCSTATVASWHQQRLVNNGHNNSEAAAGSRTCIGLVETSGRTGRAEDPPGFGLKTFLFRRRETLRPEAGDCRRRLQHGRRLRRPGHRDQGLDARQVLHLLRLGVLRQHRSVLPDKADRLARLVLHVLQENGLVGSSIEALVHKYTVI